MSGIMEERGRLAAEAQQRSEAMRQHFIDDARRSAVALLKNEGWRIVKLSPWADDDSDSWPSEYVYTIMDEL